MSFVETDFVCVCACDERMIVKTKKSPPFDYILSKMTFTCHAVFLSFKYKFYWIGHVLRQESIRTCYMEQQKIL